MQGVNQKNGKWSMKDVEDKSKQEVAYRIQETQGIIFFISLKSDSWYLIKRIIKKAIKDIN